MSAGPAVDSVDWERHEGAPSPLGPSWSADGRSLNFALYSRHASAVSLLLYGGADLARPIHSLALDPFANRTGPIWHCRLAAEALGAARYYAYLAAGPDGGHDGFDPEKVLLDPYAPSVHLPPGFDRRACGRPGPTAGRAPLGVLPPREAPHWTPPAPGPRHGHDAVIYELHVRGFTMRPSSGVAPEKRGSFLGLLEKLPYLRDLGVTIVELLPVQQFDPQEGTYWGYMTLHYFSPHAAYARGDAHAEFAEMVRGFHAAGIEVWLDVVYNHTSEADTGSGPTYSLRGLDRKSYYLLEDDGRDRNDTGCGNTLRCGHPVVRRLVTDSVRFWAERHGVDGFRFDLASIFTRDARGDVSRESPLVEELSALGDRHAVRLVAEAWDLSAYQLGHSFPGISWRQWNGAFRDDVRRFVRGDAGCVPLLMRRVYGSDDLFPDAPPLSYRPFQSINFVSCHDGFSLYDLVSHERKHNEANGAGNRDGAHENFSSNCGHEGDAGAPPEVHALRRRQARNLFALLMLANGTPMFLAGDEFLNTQRGNNNPHNRDDETSWLDWERVESERDFHRFARALIAFRKAHPSLGRSRFWREDVSWHGASGAPDLSHASRAVAWCVHGASHGDDDVYVMANAGSEASSFAIGVGEPGEWRRAVDTALRPPDDVAPAGAEPVVSGREYGLADRSVVVLVRRR
ncbi:MAG: glycogen-debranching protein [Vicinamibacteria bacterium]